MTDLQRVDLVTANVSYDVDPKIEKLIFFLVASAAPVLALTTSSWSGNGGFVRDFMRLFSTPVTIVEIMVILIGVREGFGFYKIWALLGRTNQMVLVALIIVAAGTTILAYADPVSAYFRTFNWIIHLLFGFTIAQMTMQSRTSCLLRMASTYVLFGLMAWLVGLVAYVMLVPNPRQFSWSDFRYGVGNVRQLGFYASVGYCLATGLAITTNALKQKIILCGCATLFVTLIYWAAVRSAVLGIALATVVAFAIVPAMRTTRTLFAMGAPIFAAVPLSLALGTPNSTIMGFWRLFGVLPEEGAEKFSSGRWEIWKGTIREWMEKPFFGFGESQFRLIVPENNGVNYHPHNVELQIAFSWGLIGAFCFFFLFGSIGLRLFRACGLYPREALPFMLAVTSLFGFAQVEGAMYHTWPVMIMATCLAIGSTRSAYKCCVAGFDFSSDGSRK